MKILYLLTQDLESPSGLGRYLPLATQMVSLGHQVTVVALHSDYGSLKPKRFVREGLEIWYVSQMHVQKHGSTKKYFSAGDLIKISLQATWRLLHAVLTIPVDIVHVGKPHPMNGLAGMLAQRMHHYQLYVDCDDYEAYIGNFRHQWQRGIVSFFEQHVPSKAIYVTTNTFFSRQRLIASGIPEEKIVYIPNGVDRKRFIPPLEGQVANLRSQLGLDGCQVVAFIGSLNLTSHPVDLLIRAFKLVRSQFTKARLLIVGGGSDLDRLADIAKQNGLEQDIIFRGRVDPGQVNLYYRVADVSVDPVYDNGAAQGRAPLKMFESWACGVPFVSCDVGDRRLLLGDPPAGILAKPGDAASLAEKIGQVLSDMDLMQLLRERGYVRVKSYYWDMIAPQLAAVYEKNIR